MKTEENKTYLITTGLEVNGTQKVIKLGSISGIDWGDKYSDLIRLTTTCFVKKVSPGCYRLLNENDHRVYNILKNYRRDSDIEVVEVGFRDVEAVEYLTGHDIPQQTSNIKFKDYIADLVLDTSHQKVIANHLATKTVRAGTTLNFDLSEFIKTLGSNAPSKATIDTYIRSSIKAISAPPLQTAPPNNAQDSQNKESKRTALQVLQELPNLVQLSDAHVKQPQPQPQADTRENHTQEPTEYISDQDPKAENQQPNLVQETSQHTQQQHQSEEILADKWNNFSGSTYDYYEIIDALKNLPIRRQSFKDWIARFIPFQTDPNSFVEKTKTFMDDMNAPKQ